jgi:hypothetical protein
MVLYPLHFEVGGGWGFSIMMMVMGGWLSFLDDDRDYDVGDSHDDGVFIVMRSLEC